MITVVGYLNVDDYPYENVIEFKFKKEDTVYSLKEAIKEKEQNDFDINDDELKLQKVDISLEELNDKLATLESNPSANIKTVLEGEEFEELVTTEKISKYFSNKPAKKHYYIIAESPVPNFKSFIEEKELIHGDKVIYNYSSSKDSFLDGEIVSVDKGFQIRCIKNFEEYMLNSLTEFIQLAIKPSGIKGMDWKFLWIELHKSKERLTWKDFCRRFHRHMLCKKKQKLRKGLEDITSKMQTSTMEDQDKEKNPKQSIDCTPESDHVNTEKNQLADRAEQLGFIRNKFFCWLSSISDELLATQTLEYWLLSYISEIGTTAANSWNEDTSSDVLLSTHFAITPETANDIIRRISAEYLKEQTPEYWVKDWVIQQSNQVTPEFFAFIEAAENSRIDTYKDVPILVVNKGPTIGENDELLLLLQSKGIPEKNIVYYYHTTNFCCAEKIIEDGIMLAGSKQDFGGKTPSFYLNDEFKWAIDFGRQRYYNTTCAILIYTITKELLEKHGHLDLSQDHAAWKYIVRRSRNGRSSDADDFDSVYGPQATNGKKLISDEKVTPRPATDKNQLALKTRKLTKEVDQLLEGVIIYRNNSQENVE